MAYFFIAKSFEVVFKFKSVFGTYGIVLCRTKFFNFLLVSTWMPFIKPATKTDYAFFGGFFVSFNLSKLDSQDMQTHVLLPLTELDL